MSFETYNKAFAVGSSVAEISLGLGTKETLQITAATLVNTSGSGRTVTTHLAYDGGAAATANAIDYTKAVGSNSSPGSGLTGHNLIPGAKIYAGADATGVTLQISGLVTAQA